MYARGGGVMCGRFFFGVNRTEKGVMGPHGQSRRGHERENR